MQSTCPLETCDRRTSLCIWNPDLRPISARTGGYRQTRSCGVIDSPAQSIVTFGSFEGSGRRSFRLTDELEVIRRDLCAGYGQRLTELKGFSPETLRKNGDAAQLFLRWLGERARPEALRKLTISDVDGFLAWRNPGLRRATRRGVTHCLRSFLDYLYGAGHLEQDLAPHVPAPTLYRLENIPSALSKDQVATLLEVTRRDRRPEGLRDAPAHQDLWAANTVSCAGTRIASTGFDYRSCLSSCRTCSHCPRVFWLLVHAADGIRRVPSPTLLSQISRGAYCES